MRHGFLLIDKPRGPTSHDIVAQVRGQLGEKKIGHLGTLDPLATGLLVLAVGAKALKVVELFQGASKEYVVELTFGATSTTCDSEGMITASPQRAGWLPPQDVSPINTIIHDHFIGKVSQVPPAHSAIRISGERAYRKARQGKNVAMAARTVEMYACDILFYGYPKLTCRISCSAGTYMRSFAHDLGQKLRCGAYMSALRRTKVGEWPVEDASSPGEALWTNVVPLKEILAGNERMDLTESQWNDIQYGRSIVGSCMANTIAWFDNLPRAILETDQKNQSMIRPRKVL